MNYLVAFFLLFSTLSFAKSHLVEIRSDNATQLMWWLQNQGIDVAGIHRNTGRLTVITTKPEGLRPKLSLFEAIQNARTRITKIEPTSPLSLRINAARNVEDYLNAAQSIAKLKQMEADYPAWAKLYDLNQIFDLPSTVDGNHIYALQISTDPSEFKAGPKVLLIGQHHAREITTHHVVMDSAQALLENLSSGDPNTFSLLKDTSVWFVPIVNPDGLNHVFEKDRMWRKNRSHNTGGSRGTDLNRNYEFKWGSCGVNSSSGQSNVYKGKSPNSEVEVQIMDRLNSKFHFQYLASFHSYGDEVLYPYKCGTLAEEEIYYQIRDEMAQLLNFRMRLASSSGEDFEHHYARYGTISFLVELGKTFQPSYATYENVVWKNAKKILPFLLEKADQPHVQFRFKDRVTQAFLKVPFTLKGIDFQEGEIRQADSFGRYYWRLKEGKYTLKSVLPGYLPFEKELQLTGNETIEILLEKDVLHPLLQPIFPL